MYIYIYIYIERERERERGRALYIYMERARRTDELNCVGFAKERLLQVAYKSLRH